MKRSIKLGIIALVLSHFVGVSAVVDAANPSKEATERAQIESAIGKLIDGYNQANSNKKLTQDEERVLKRLFKTGAILYHTTNGFEFGENNVQIDPRYLNYSKVIGKNHYYTGQNAILIGEQNFGVGIQDITIGFQTHAYARNSMAIGSGAVALPTFHEGKPYKGEYAPGYQRWEGNNNALGVDALASGSSNAYGAYARAIGTGSLALGNNAVAAGLNHQLIRKIEKESDIYTNTGLQPLNISGEVFKYFQEKNNLNSAEEVYAYVKEVYKDFLAENSFANIEATNPSDAKSILTRLAYQLAYNPDEGRMTTAVGTNSYASTEGSIALGAGSISARDPFTETGVIAPYSNFHLTKNNTIGALSVGTSKQLRQIIHVADGTQDTDAVNLRQLQKAIESVTNQGNTPLVEVQAKPNTPVEVVKTEVTDDGKTKTVYTVGVQVPTIEVAGDPDNKNIKVDKVVTDGNIKYVLDIDFPAVSSSINLTTKEGSGLILNKSTDPDTNEVNYELDMNPVDVAITKKIDGKEIPAGENKKEIAFISGNNISLQEKGGEIVIGTTDKVKFAEANIGGVVVNESGINAAGKKITNLADGEISPTSTDAVNGSQLYAVTSNYQSLSNEVKSIGAGASALAGLHPLDFDPDDKWDFAYSYGKYQGKGASALGAFYRPNEDTMFSVSGTIGSGNDMWNAGVSFKVGQGNHVSVSRVAMAKEIRSLRSEVEELKSIIGALLPAYDINRTSLFPDIPENHWAYEEIARLKGNGIAIGYPDGTYGGDRNMTRYEFGVFIDRMLRAGQPVSERLVNEFETELKYIRIDTLRKDKDGNPTLQRVRAIPEMIYRE